MVAFNVAIDKRDQIPALGASARLRWTQLVAQLSVRACKERRLAALAVSMETVTQMAAGRFHRALMALGTDSTGRLVCVPLGVTTREGRTACRVENAEWKLRVETGGSLPKIKQGISRKDGKL